MNLSSVDKALLLSAYYRGNSADQAHWSSSCDQVVTLSLFYTGDMTSEECEVRFSKRGYVARLYDADGELNPQIEMRYRDLIGLIMKYPQLIEGGGNLKLPADPTYTACRLTQMGIDLVAHFVNDYPRKPEFPNWPDTRMSPTT